jgi:hypothetical protein
MNLTIFILLSVVTVSCTVNDDNNDIPGRYRTVVFIQPGPADQPLDLNEKGGYVEFELRKDFTFKAKFFTPDLPDFQMKETEMNFEGTYSINEDTIKISGTNIFLDNELFFYKDRKLEIKNKLPGLMDLVLEKVEE